jgi:hypothetical protein
LLMLNSMTSGVSMLSSITSSLPTQHDIQLAQVERF